MAKQTFEIRTHYRYGWRRMAEVQASTKVEALGVWFGKGARPIVWTRRRGRILETVGVSRAWLKRNGELREYVAATRNQWLQRFRLERQ